VAALKNDDDDARFLNVIQLPVNCAAMDRHDDVTPDASHDGARRRP